MAALRIFSPPATGSEYALYVNQKDGTFENEIEHRTIQLAYAGLGADSWKTIYGTKVE